MHTLLHTERNMHTLWHASKMTYTFGHNRGTIRAPECKNEWLQHKHDHIGYPLGVAMVALRDIEAGEPILLDYGKLSNDFFLMVWNGLMMQAIHSYGV